MRLMVLLAVISLAFTACSNSNKQYDKTGNPTQIGDEPKKVNPSVSDIFENKLQNQYALAKSQVYAIAVSVESYSHDKYMSPQVDSYEELHKAPLLYYFGRLPKKDPWGSNYYYSRDKTDRHGYRIVCFGVDKTRGTPDDIIFTNGSFIAVPTDMKDLGINLRVHYADAMVDIKRIALGIDSFRAGSGDYPDAGTVDKLKTLIEPDHIRECPVKDPWGNRYLYKYVDNDNYFIACAGSDGKFDGFDQKGTYDLAKAAGKDVVYSNGKFVFPE